MIAARAIALILCVLSCAAASCASAQAPDRARSTKALVRYGGANAGTAQVDVIAPLGRAWGEPALRDFLAALRIEGGEPYVRRGDFTAFRQNKKLGVELT